ncbi:acid phosphatase [Sandaracinobacteroides hominis]|uniref:acid phosphatase n=1 Tax=Sandaracinobacteroides hominis TaxID=2780086 RepID=UPI0018F66E25|nr:phosphatase PAP2 family protein [Sandaracinobacteroides hominis]
MRNGIGALLALGLLAGCATTATTSVTAPPVPPTSIEAVGMLSPSIPFPKGYLDPKALPDSLALLPPPPAAGTAAKAADEEAFKAGMAAPAERQALAAADADLSSWAHIVSSFEPIVGTSLSDGSNPHTEMLLRRSIADAGVSTGKAKAHYQRVRPFVENNVGTCRPQDEPALRKDGSYPSGHTAIGWMMALVLTDLFPDKADAILQRGYDFGQSRVVCRAHWMTDTVSGRTISAATYARLQSDPTFKAQRELARAELAKVAGK